MSLAAWLFRDGQRYFPGQRWVSVSLRSLHLVGVAGMGAGILGVGASSGAGHGYLILTLLTGVAMTVIYAWSDGRWLVQLCGQSVLVKLLLIALIPLWPVAAPALFIATILISGLISHAPARVRHFEPLRRRSNAPERSRARRGLGE